MASVHCGQAALLSLPPVPDPKRKQPTTVTSYALPPTLQVERKLLKAGENVGIEVFKVSKVSRELEVRS
jgi:hypothetical protein